MCVRVHIPTCADICVIEISNETKRNENNQTTTHARTRVNRKNKQKNHHQNVKLLSRRVRKIQRKEDGKAEDKQSDLRQM